LISSSDTVFEDERYADHYTNPALNRPNPKIAAGHPRRIVNFARLARHHYGRDSGWLCASCHSAAGAVLGRRVCPGGTNVGA
jgi:hypothetical protein